MKSAERRQGDLNGFLDRGSHLHGNLQFDTHFRVHGKLTGQVSTTGELIIGEGGEVEGELRVGQIVVSGVVRGTIHASGRVQITATGKVFADVETPSLVVEDGAFFAGRCAMDKEPAKAAAAGAGGGPKLVAAKAAAFRDA
jgi:cytoskeletal protein CcmA (bactofilin family)